MTIIKLNTALVQKELKKLKIGPTSLSIRLGISRQLACYIIKHGGYKYAFQLAQVIGCQEKDLLISPTVIPPKGMKIVNNKVRKEK